MRVVGFVLLAAAACGRTPLDVPDVIDAATDKPTPAPPCHDWRLPAGAGCSPAPEATVLFEEKVAGFEALAVDDANVYWTDIIGSTPIVQTLHAVSKCGGTPSVLATGFGMEGRSILVRGGFVWGFELDGLVRVAVTGGPVEHLGEPGGLAEDFALDDTTMFGAVQDDVSSGNLVTYSLTNRSTSLLASCAEAYFARVAVDCATVFFTLGRDYRTQLASVPKTGGPVTVLTDLNSSGGELPGPIAMDNEALYWLRLDSKLLRVKKDGTDVRTLVADVPALVAVDDVDVYFLSRVWNAIERMPKLGGTPEVVTSTGRVGALALDETDLFWADVGDLEGYRILRISK